MLILSTGSPRLSWPATPPEARANQISGRVLLDILFRRDGTTAVAKVTDGLPHGCTEAAVEHARQWRWKLVKTDRASAAPVMGRPA